MSTEVKVSIENGKSRIFLLEDEDLTLKNLREKIKAKRWEAAGSNFYFLKNDSEIDQEDEVEYKLSKFKNGEVIEVVVSPQQSEEEKAAEKKNVGAKEQNEANERKEAAQKVRKTAEEALNKQNLLEGQLDPNKKQNWKDKEAPDTGLIKDEGEHRTDKEGIYLTANWEQLNRLFKSLRFPKALRITSQGLEPVLQPGVKLSRAISQDDVMNEVELNDQSDAYYTEWEKEAYKMGCKSVSASVGIPIPQLSAVLGVSASYETSSESLAQRKETRLYMVAQRLVQKAKVILDKNSLQLTDEFKQSVERAVQTKNIADLRRVFQEYGYFVPTAYIIGGKIIAEQTKTLSAQEDKSAEVNKFGTAVSAELDKAGFTASASGGYKSGSTEKTSESSSQSTRSFQMKLRGGDEALLNNGTAWVSSLKLDTWQIVGYEGLKPITDFLSEELKKECETILVNSTEVSSYDPQRSYEPIVNESWDNNYFGSLKEIYADTNPVHIPKGKKLVGIAFRQHSNRLAPRILVANLDGSNPEWKENNDWGSNYFPNEGGLSEIYADTNPVHIPAGKKLVAFAFRQHGNRLAPKILVANVDGSDERWVENNDWGSNYFPNEGGLSEIYADTNQVLVPTNGKSLVGFALRQKRNRLAPALLVQ